MSDLTARRESWFDYLPGDWQQAVNTSPVLNALGRALNRRPADIEGASKRIFSQPGDREMDDRAWLLQQAQPQRRLNPLAAEMLDKGGILANFLGPGVKLPRVGSPQSRFSGLPDHLAAPLVHDQWDQLLSRIPTTQTKVDGFNLLRDPSWDRVHYSLAPDGVTSRWNPDGSGVPLIGRFQVKPSQNGGIEVTNAFIEQPYTGKGLGQKVYDAIASDFQGTPVIPSSWNQLSPHAVSFWSKRDPEMLARIRDIQRASWEGDMFPDRMIQPAAPKPTGIRAYHGSPHDFDKFDISKIGTGEGAQAYGRGLYFAESEGVAKSYRDRLSQPMDYKFDGGPFRHSDPSHVAALRVHQEGRDEAILRLRENAKRLAEEEKRFGRYQPDAKIYAQAADMIERGTYAKLDDLGSPGRMYEVNIKADPEHFLDYDKAIQSPYVTEALARLKEAGFQNPLHLAGSRGLEKRVAEVNKAAVDAGIPGIKYLDQGSRAAGQGSRNYVVFDDKLIEILRKYGLLPPVVAGTASAMQQPETDQ